MWIMIAGPYTSGAADAAARAANLRAMNAAAWAVFQKGHVPVIGVNNALPVIEVAGPEHFEALMMPISLAMAERCDAVLRIGGPSRGADQELERFQARGLPVYRSVEAVPAAGPSARSWRPTSSWRTTPTRSAASASWRRSCRRSW